MGWLAIQLIRRADLKQFALIQMNMGREVTRRLREADNRLFAWMGPDADMSIFPGRLS